MASSRGKRKIAQVSYSNIYEELDTLVFGDDQEARKEVRKEEYSKALERKRKRERPMPMNKRQKASVFPFLSLPPELRNQIYAYALSQGTAAQNTSPVSIAYASERERPFIFRSVTYAAGQSEWKAFVPQLLRVCKQIRDEATPILYDTKCSFSNASALHKFLLSIGQDNRNRLKKIAIKDWDAGSRNEGSKAFKYACMSLLAECKNIERIFMHCVHGSSYDAPKTIARRIYRESNVFFDVQSAFHAKKYAGLKVLKLSDANFYQKSTGPEERKRIFKEKRHSVFEELKKCMIEEEKKGPKMKHKHAE